MYAYDYETAVHTDHVLVPYYNYEVKTKFIEEGITYDSLSEEDRERYEEDFIEDGYIPDFIPSNKLNKFVFNELTVDMEGMPAFINDESLNQKQISFVHKIINHIEQNGFMNDVSDLLKPPFDKPVGFTKLFDKRTQTLLLNTIRQIKENAIRIVA